jgi:hypothetical protein
MLRVAPVAMVAAVLFCAPAQAAEYKRCKAVAFTPNSDDVATGIQARNIGCRRARRLVRRSQGTPPVRFEGWACSSKERAMVEGLAHVVYRCERGARTVRWKRY